MAPNDPRVIPLPQSPRRLVPRRETRLEYRPETRLEPRRRITAEYSRVGESKLRGCLHGEETQWGWSARGARGGRNSDDMTAGFSFEANGARFSRGVVRSRYVERKLYYRGRTRWDGCSFNFFFRSFHSRATRCKSTAM